MHYLRRVNHVHDASNTVGQGSYYLTFKENETKKFIREAKKSSHRFLHQGNQNKTGVIEWAFPHSQTPPPPPSAVIL